MEGNDLHEGGSSSIWRDTAVEVFSTSFRREDDESALKWAALERLPTYARLRRGLLTTSSGKANEIAVHELGIQQRKNLVERLVRDAEVDNEEFLLKLKERIDRVGIEIPPLEVRFEHLQVEANAYVGSRALPSFFNYCINIVEGLLTSLHILSSRKKNLSILHDVSGIIRPSRMTLLLGPPSSGKTTLLLALAGKLDPDLKFSGRVTYNGYGMHEFVPQRSAAYISQHDLHMPEMTVKETLAFSARCQGVGPRHEWLAELLRREKEAQIKPDPDIDVFMKAASIEGLKTNVITDYVLKILGLEICADTLVGDEMLRGISGGQRKRVTTGEMLVGPAKVLLMDEISNGLDSSTTFQIVNSLKQYIHTLNGTAVLSLLQPAPETYELFDDIILLSDGQIVFQGPREQALEFFASMGFKCPERKGEADFLQEVTSRKDQKQYWAHEDESYRFITVKEFADAFQSFQAGKQLEEELATPFDKGSNPSILPTEKYGARKHELLKACFSREFLLMKRNSFVYMFKLIQLTVMAFLSMTLFLRTEMHRDTLMDGEVYVGSLFYTVLIIMFNGMSELGLTILKLPVFYKQRDFLFFPAWAYALPTWILKIPVTLVEVGIWVFMSYYVVGYDPDVKRLFKQYLLLVVLNQVASALFRCIAALGRDLIIGNTLGSFVLLVLFTSGGFVLSRENFKKWWKWCYWISPLMYGQNAIAVNEFLGKNWGHVDPNLEEPLGIAVLNSRGFFPHAYWYWISVGALTGFTLLFNFLYTLALTYLNDINKPQSCKSEDSQSSEHVDGTGNSSCHNADAGDEAEIRSSSSTRSNGASNSAQKRMVLPFEPHSLTFDNIVYSVDMPQEMKHQGVNEDKLALLKAVSGAFRPGVLTALMGVSGAGKTTLMDVLAGRKTGGYVEGNIKISGYPKKQETFARISGYCEQNDIHSPHVTVYESLLFSAWLRLPRGINTETRKVFIEDVMELVELNTLRQALVGLPGVNGLSTEQRKRLTIAVELVANPSIIFMDEPTSGLDARAAAIVMRTVRNTVDTGRTVVCTIHQPSIDIFEAFDELFLLKRGGEAIYVGPLGSQSCLLIKYFEGIEGVNKIKDGYNPATWMLEVTTQAQESALGVDFAELYKNSELYRRNKELIQEMSKPVPGSKDLHFSTKFARSFSTQCIACLIKQRWSYWRNPQYTAVRFLSTVVIALILGTMFWDLGSKKTKLQDLLNSLGSLYAAILFLGLQNTTGVLPVVAIERTVFYRERAAGMYSALPYALAHVIVELPYILSQAVVYGVIFYAMVGFERSATKFFWYLFFMYFTLLYFTFYGMMLVGLTPNYLIAFVTSTFFLGIWSLFSGYVIPRTRMPVWWRWYYWGCPLSWTLYGIAATQFGEMKDKLETGETVEQFLRDYFGYKHDFVGVVAAAVAGFALLFAFIFAVSIKILNFQKR